MSENSSGESSSDAQQGDSLKRFHATLLLLEKAGVPLQLGDFQTNVPLTQQLRELESRIDPQLALGAKLVDVVSQGTQLPKVKSPKLHLPGNYRLALQQWVRDEGSPDAFQVLTAEASARKELRGWCQIAWLQPLTLALLALLALINLVFFIGPQLDTIYQQLSYPRGFGISVLNLVREKFVPLSLGIAILGFGVAFAISYANRRRVNVSGRCRKGIVKATRDVALAEQATSLGRAGFSPSQILEVLVGDGGANSPAIEFTQSNGEAKRSIEPEEALPRLLESVLRTSAFEATSERAVGLSGSTVPGLQFAKDVYSHRLVRRRGELRNRMPALLTALVGGIIVGLLALAVFFPLIELMYMILEKRGG